LLSLYIDQNRFDLFMKFLKTFENFGGDDSAMDMCCCPTCDSQNVSSVNGEHECIDCGEMWGDTATPADEPLDMPADEMPAERTPEGAPIEGEEEYRYHEPSAYGAMEDDGSGSRNGKPFGYEEGPEEDDEYQDEEAMLADADDAFEPRRISNFANFTEEEEMMDDSDVPSLSDDEVSNYQDDSAKIETMLAKAAQMDEELADQLEFVAGESDDLSDFILKAKAAIQDVKGVSEEEAAAIVNTLM
jgi:hypothetical protein